MFSGSCLFHAMVVQNGWFAASRQRASNAPLNLPSVADLLPAPQLHDDIFDMLSFMRVVMDAVEGTSFDSRHIWEPLHIGKTC